MIKTLFLEFISGTLRAEVTSGSSLDASGMPEVTEIALRVHILWFRSQPLGGSTRLTSVGYIVQSY